MRSSNVPDNFPYLNAGRGRNHRDPLGNDSPLDRPLTVTFFDDIAGTSKREESQSLRELADLVEDTVRPSKERLPLFKCATFGNRRSAKRSFRHDGNLDRFDALETDYDAGEMPIQEARDLLKKAGLAALLYESPSSTREAPRFRVVLPCSKAMHPEDRKRLVARADGVLGDVLASESYASSQSYYIGTVKGKQPEILLVEGRYIDHAHDLDAGAIGKDGNKTRDHLGADSPEDVKRHNADKAFSGDLRRLRECVMAIDPVEHGGYRDWLGVIQAIDHETDGSAEGLELADEWSQGCADYDPQELEEKWDSFGRYGGKRLTGNHLKKISNWSGVSDDEFEDLGKDPDAKNDSEITVTMASEITPENINWFWKGRLAEGKGTMLTGLPGMGKSQLSLNIAATISKGGRWPDGTRAPKGTVLILASEDAANDTMVPRIIAAGGNREKIGFIQQTVGRKGKRRILTLKEDLDRLAQAIRKFGDAKLVIIDPITGYMGNGVDSHKATDVRAVLSGVSEWAQDLGIAVLAITHPAKSVTSAMNAMVGSQAYVAFFRMNFIAGEHPDDADLHEDKRRRVFSKVKGNNGKHVESFSYTIESVTVEGDIESSRIVWGEEVAVRADDLVSSEPKKSKKSDEAKEFLKSQWDFDPDEQIAVTKLQSLARDKGIAWRTIERAKEKLPIMPKKIDGKWFWSWRS